MIVFCKICNQEISDEDMAKTDAEAKWFGGGAKWLGQGFAHRKCLALIEENRDKSIQKG